MKAKAQVRKKITTLNYPAPLILQAALEHDRDRFVSARATKLFNEVIDRAIAHAPTLNPLSELELALWLYDIDLDLGRLKWFQYGLPRLKAISESISYLTWPEKNKMISRMAKGKKCQSNCDLCAYEQVII